MLQEAQVTLRQIYIEGKREGMRRGMVAWIYMHVYVEV